MKDIVIVGAGGFGREVKMIIDRINNLKPTYNILGFYDDDQSYKNEIHGLSILGTIANLLEEKETIAVVFGIGIPDIKTKIYKQLITNKNLSFPNIIDPSAIIGEDSVNVGKGCVICAQVVITCDVEIKDFVTLNLSCTVGHDAKIDSFSSFMPSVNVSGEVHIDSKVYVGTGAKILNQINIGTQTIIGAGAVVSKSLPAHCTAVGIPAKPIKFHNE